ncbi:MAG: LLM class flavin-dependent oxidoreductase [Acidimicrobiia bacterium]|nr:LLM class flavin-dependent oxidoreductase [Acidimicrobiia bacterium]
MDIGLALPTMADGWDRSTLLDWCRITDEGPFSSISCGERITYHNVEMISTLSAAAALTERVRVMVNLAISPWHSTMLLAKQIATMDLISDGRLDLGLGVGGREQDYRAVGSPFAARHQRLDDQVVEMRRLWSGQPALPDAPPLGPAVVQPGGPPLYAGALGPKATARAAAWADGISGFSLGLDGTEIANAVALARSVWADHGRVEPPRFVVACFAVAGVADGPAVLSSFTRSYMAIFGDEFAGAMASMASLHSDAAVADALAALRDSGLVDEVIIVPGSIDPACADALAAVASSF